MAQRGLLQCLLEPRTSTRTTGASEAPSTNSNAARSIELLFTFLYTRLLKAESLRVPGAREVAELEKFRLWAQNGAKVPTTLIVGGAGGFWLSKMLGIR